MCICHEFALKCKTNTIKFAQSRTRIIQKFVKFGVFSGFQSRIQTIYYLYFYIKFNLPDGEMESKKLKIHKNPQAKGGNRIKYRFRNDKFA